jgi:hypothetical protein
MTEIEQLKREIELKNELIAAKEAVIAAKDEVIAALKAKANEPQVTWRNPYWDYYWPNEPLKVSSGSTGTFTTYGNGGPNTDGSYGNYWSLNAKGPQATSDPY